MRLGPHGVLQLTKRATCSTKNVVYVGVCLRCEELGGEDDWCVYFGETSQTLRRRCSMHLTQPCNTASILKQRRFSTAASKRAKIERVLAGLDEEEGILQDWFPHVCVGGIHEGFQRMSVVDVLPLRLHRIHRETGLVLQWMMRDGAIDYRGMGRGCVNTYSDNRYVWEEAVCVVKESCWNVSGKGIIWEGVMDCLFDFAGTKGSRMDSATNNDYVGGGH